MTNLIRSSREIAMERIQQFKVDNARDADAGLEAFLHLLKPDLSSPRLVVEPAFLHLNLDKGENREVHIRLLNTGRGYLHGTIELADPVDGAVLSANRFGINSKGNSEATITLRVDTASIPAGTQHRTAVIINSNSTAKSVSIPLTVRVEERTRRSAQSAESAYRWGVLLLCPYIIMMAQKLGLIHKYGINTLPETYITHRHLLSGIQSAIAVIVNMHTVEVRAALILLFLGAGISIPLAIRLSGRHTRWHQPIWFFIAWTLIIYALVSAKNEGLQAYMSIFLVFTLFALLPLPLSVLSSRLLSFRFPHLPSFTSLIVTLLLFGICWAGFSLHSQSLPANIQEGERTYSLWLGSYYSQGTFKWADGSAYIGEWSKGKGHGRGYYRWPDGAKYEGGWANGKRSGYGTYTYPDGRMLVFRWRNDKIRSSGMFISEKKKVFIYEWKSRGLYEPWNNRYVEFIGAHWGVNSLDEVEWGN